MRITQFLFEKIGKVSEMTEKYSNLPKSYIRRSMRQVNINAIRSHCEIEMNLKTYFASPD